MGDNDQESALHSDGIVACWFNLDCAWCGPDELDWVLRPQLIRLLMTKGARVAGARGTIADRVAIKCPANMLKGSRPFPGELVSHGCADIIGSIWGIQVRCPMITRLLLSLFAVLFTFQATPSIAQERLALVIGNQDYSSVPKLSRAKNDAEAIGAVLQGLGFDVTKALDADEAAMGDAIDSFVGKVSPGDTVVVHFSGHGVEIEGRNYLLPVDAPSPDTASDGRLRRTAFDLRDAVIDPIRRKGARVTFAVIDACRDNPYVGATKSIGATRGLGRMDAEEGEFLLFSAQPGQKALDALPQNDSEATSVFTRVFIRHLAKPGQPLVMIAKATQEEVKTLAREGAGFSQFPDYVDRIVGMPALVDARLDADSTVQTPADQAGAALSNAATESANKSAAPTPDPAAIAFASLDHSNPEALRAFLALYPSAGAPSADAKRFLAELGKQPHECDRLAGRLNAPTLPQGVSGVDFDQIETTKAISECQNARRLFPDVARFMTWLGRAYDKDKRYDLAIDLYREAADLGDTVGMNNLGLMYEEGTGVPKDAAEAVRWYRKAADTGDARGMVNLGSMYELGTGVSKDAEEAARWYRKAADLGDARGMVNLGYLYEQGTGVSKDAAEAVGWYIRAADLGNALAMNNLGVMYERGAGISKDAEEAARWYRKAADLGNALAMGNLGNRYDIGSGVSIDAAEAAHWLIRSLESRSEYHKKTIIDEKGKAYRKQTRIAIQTILIERGLLSGPADGSFGQKTITALEKTYNSAQ
jgi:TPR repeat protein